MARQVEDYLGYARPVGVAGILERAIDAARQRTEQGERAVVAARIGELVAASGLATAEFASRIGTSRTRLSTYRSGQVTPSPRCWSGWSVLWPGPSTHAAPPAHGLGPTRNRIGTMCPGWAGPFVERVKGNLPSGPLHPDHTAYEKEHTMAQYLLSVHSRDEDHVSGPVPEDVKAIFAAVDRFNDELRTSGSWVFAGGLHPASTATVVDGTGSGDAVVTDGPYLEAKEHLGGFWVVDVTDLDAALNLARRGSAACQGKVEVRPFQHELDA